VSGAALGRGVYGVMLELQLSSDHDLDRVPDRPAVDRDFRARIFRYRTPFTEGPRELPRIASPALQRRGSRAAKAQRSQRV